MKERLKLLSALDEGAAENEVFRLALLHVVSELGALGGMVHLSGPMSALRLVSASGLPPILMQAWEIIGPEGTAAPARAVRQGSPAWAPTTPLQSSANGSSANAWPDTGMAAVPVFAGERTVGVLTVLTGHGGEPTGEQWGFLQAVVAWVEERMGLAPPAARPLQGHWGSAKVREALKEVQIGSWDWNIQTGEMHWDEAILALYEMEPSQFVPRIETFLMAIHPDDVASTLAAAEKSINDRTLYDAEFRIRLPDGTFRWVHSRAKVVLDDEGEPLRMIGGAWGVDEPSFARNALARALRHMSDSFLSVDDDWRVVFANLEAERALGSSEEELLGRVLWELPRVRQVRGLEERCRNAAAASVPVGFDIRIPSTGRSYHLRLVPVPDGTICYFTDVTEQRKRDAERKAAEQAAAERSDRIAELTTALAKATSSRDVVDAVARWVLPPFGAVGLVMQTIEGDRAYNVGAVGYPQEFLDRLEGSRFQEATPVWDSLLSGAPVFISSAEEYAARYPSGGDLPHKAGKQSWAFLPLTASGRLLGTCVISFNHPRRLTGEERTLLTAISGLVAQAFDRARLYDSEHRRAQELQRGLLPRALPALPACTAAARYLPAGHGMEVGGDWYDVIPLSADQVALVVGDVMGHGLSEAATMGRLRTAVHTLADLELPPDEILSRLNEIVSDLGEDSYATCLYAIYDPTTRICTFARAGHPPPAVVHPDGSVYLPETVPDPPLGVAEPPFETSQLQLPEGSLFVLYTDGLIESSQRDIDDGLTLLTELLSTAHSGGVDRICDTLIAGLLPADQQGIDDDATLLVTRVRTLSADQIVSWALPEDPRAAGEARAHVREQLSAWKLDDLAMSTELLASELVGNVVRHAKGPIQLRLLRSANLICEVSDGSLTTPRIRRASETDEGGRGLQLVAALSQRWGTRYTATGKSIWTEQALPAVPPSPDAHSLAR
ncbi:SpoIIE family protein phosphatase [Streptomyces muensis]|uniref:protein-serine/threonine phosphatase n=1 Tax=Streptomyces muensis TaxID=1077944 RepID=A0A9X1PT36_STRM4|nr:SpoIIE family protein phosphatase [Streptomyces muensis]MCF1592516.1 SpoIIE family protein phosphatase [Streptomyces muensis]